MAFAEEVSLPYFWTVIGNGEQIKENDLVEFRLLFSGDLPSTGNASKPDEVHRIRRTFHPQLRRLWSAEANLGSLVRVGGGGPYPATDEEQVRRGFEAIGKKWSRAEGFQLIPLVTPDMTLRCSIDILLLRPEIEPRFLMRRADIDGQVKTLRIPENLDETGGQGPGADETPFFCLLQDDRLITEVRVNTDRLLLLPNSPTVKPNDCFAVIYVKLNHQSARTFDNYFG
jgi:hypothetical protein